MKRLILIFSLLLSGLAFANPPGTFQPLLIGGTPKAVCTGGSSTSSGGYTILTFTTNGTLTCTVGGPVNYLIVAGGASGGAWQGAGGGAGGILTGTDTLAATTFSIVVGGTASGVVNAIGVSGNLSSFNSHSATGGGGGGSGQGAPYSGQNGGSGGGAASLNGTLCPATAGTGTAGQGFNGGGCAGGGDSGGGGGGYGSIGGTAAGTTGGAGGNGLASPVPGASDTYACGGGGGASTTGGAAGCATGSAGGTNAVAPSNASLANSGHGGGGARASGQTSARGEAGRVVVWF